MAKGEKPILSIRIDAELLDRIDELKDLAEVGRAEIVERCLEIGLAHQEDLVAWLKNPVAGPMFRLLSHKLILKAVGVVVGNADWADPTTVKLRTGTINKGRGRGKAKPATQ